MGVSQDRKRKHRMDLIGEKRKYTNPSIDYSKIPDPPKPQRKKIKQNISEDNRSNHKLARFIPGCRENID